MQYRETHLALTLSPAPCRVGALACCWGWAPPRWF